MLLIRPTGISRINIMGNKNGHEKRKQKIDCDSIVHTSIFYKINDCAYFISNISNMSPGKHHLTNDSIQYILNNVIKVIDQSVYTQYMHLNYICHSYLFDNNVGIMLVEEYHHRIRNLFHIIQKIHDSFIKHEFFITNKNRLKNHTKDINFGAINDHILNIINNDINSTEVNTTHFAMIVERTIRKETKFNRFIQT